MIGNDCKIPDVMQGLSFLKAAVCTSWQQLIDVGTVSTTFVGINSTRLYPLERSRSRNWICFSTVGVESM